MESIPAEIEERFKVLETLPSSPTGPLFRVEDLRGGRKGVLKLIASSTSSSTSEKQRIKRELVKQATLDDPHLALPIVTGEAEGGLWLFRDWVDGQTLRDRLEEGSLSASDALVITAQVARALDELHRAGLLHRDLKPEHIVLGNAESGVLSVTLLDAGLAAKIETDSVFDVLGTPAYVSPEQAKGKLVSFRSDLYGLGCVLYEMVVGTPPFAGETPAELLTAHAEAPIPELPESLPQGARDLLASLLAKDPRERPFSAQQVRRVLDPFVPEQLRLSSAAPAHKETLLGMPAVTVSRPPEPPSGEHPVISANRPPRPPSMSPPRPPSMMPAVEAPAPASKVNPDKTQQLAAVDILEEQVLQKHPISVPPPPPSASKAPPPPPSASKAPPSPQDAAPASEASAEAPAAAPIAAASQPSSVEAASADAAPAAALPSLGATAVPSAPPAPPGATEPVAPPPGGLDYDDLAETIARDAPASLAGMEASVAAPSYPAVDDPGMAAPTQPLHAVSTAPAASAPVVSQPVVASAQAAPPERSLAIPILIAATFLLCSLIVAGAIIYSSQSGSESVASAPPPNVAPVRRPTPSIPPPPAPSAMVDLPKPPAAAADQAAADQAAADQAAADQAAAEAAAAQAAADEAAAQAAADEAAAAQAAADEAAAAQAAADMNDTANEDRGHSRHARSTHRASTMAASSMASGESAFDQIRDQARQLYQQRRFAEAATAYRRATVMNPRHAGSFAGLGASLLAVHDARGAVAAYQRAVQLSPSRAGFYTALGNAYVAGGDRNRARQVYQRALALDPSNASARAALAHL